ncbi:MAG: hypothetical protein ABI863_22885 [Ginsengibacter sp.]
MHGVSTGGVQLFNYLHGPGKTFSSWIHWIIHALITTDLFDR